MASRASGVVVLLAEENHRREARARDEILHPVDAATARPVVRHDHGVETLRDVFRRGDGMRHGARHGELRIRPSTGEVMADERAVARVVLDHQDAHGSAAAASRVSFRPMTMSPTFVPVGPVLMRSPEACSAVPESAF